MKVTGTKRTISVPRPLESVTLAFEARADEPLRDVEQPVFQLWPGVWKDRWAYGGQNRNRSILNTRLGRADGRAPLILSGGWNHYELQIFEFAATFGPLRVRGDRFFDTGESIEVILGKDPEDDKSTPWPGLAIRDAAITFVPANGPGVSHELEGFGEHVDPGPDPDPPPPGLERPIREWQLFGDLMTGCAALNDEAYERAARRAEQMIEAFKAGALKP